MRNQKVLIMMIVANLLLSTTTLRAEPTWTFEPSSGTLTIGGDGAISWEVGQEIRSAYGTNIKHVVFTADSNITAIGGSVFQNSYNLESVTLPNTITSISGYAFAGCSKLTSINIPNSVTSIGTVAFADTKLTNVVIPPSTGTGPGMFDNCTELKEVTLSPSQLSHPGSARLYKTDFEEKCGSHPTLSSDVCADARAYFEKNPTADHFWYASSVFGTTDLSNVMINCRGDISECEAVMRYLNYGTGSGQKGKYNLVQKLDDGSTAIYRNGKLVSFKGKRIYTVKEADMVTSQTGNTVKIRYK